MKAEATVGVLTAEVKTLLIGSRQVTLSVWYQLDEVPDDEIIPFGRVSPPKNTDPVIWIVGKHKGDGTLVRSSRPLSKMGMDDVLRSQGWTRFGSTRDDPMSPPRDKGIFRYTMADIQKRIAEDEEKYKTAIEELEGKSAEWQALDLIVLAGLGLK